MYSLLALVAISQSSQLYDSNRRELGGSQYYSTPYGTQDQYYINQSPDPSQYYREPTGKLSGYYTIPRGKTTYQQGHYDRGRFYVPPTTPYPGEKPSEEYLPNKGE